MVTKRQQQTYEVILSLSARHDYLPTLDEIAHASGINTRSTVHEHVKALIQAGKLLPGVGKQAYRIPDPVAANHPPMAFVLPLWQVAAGVPIASHSGEEIDFTALLGGVDGLYAMRVRGESMIDIGINDGDLVIIQQQEVANNGEIVVAAVDGLTDDLEATLKRFYSLADGYIELRPENANLKPMIYPAQRVKIQGKMVGLFRKY